MKIKDMYSFKFAKGQTLFLLEFEFFISVRKIHVLEIIKNHGYEINGDDDFWGSQWVVGDALRVLEDGDEKIIPLEDANFIRSLVFTSQRKVYNFLKYKLCCDVDHFALAQKSFFVTNFWLEDVI